MTHPSFFARRSFLLGLSAIALAGTEILPGSPETKPEVRFRKVLFLGNSITLHAPLPSIGWHGNWGMAATSADRDYVHLVTSGLTKLQGSAPETITGNIAGFERGDATYDVEKNHAGSAAAGASHIILAVGENVPPLTTPESKALFKDKMTRLLRLLKGPQKPVILVRSQFPPDPVKDGIMRETCEAAGGVFVDISCLGADETNFARSERDYPHAGVGGHPGDRGMKAIADSILRALPTP